MDQSQQPVIIVGGSLIGLSAAMSLAVYKSPSVVIEKHSEITKHPRAIGFTPRIMEIFSALGIIYKITQVASISN